MEQASKAGRADNAARRVRKSNTEDRLAKLREFLQTHHVKAKGPKNFEAFEQELHSRLMAFEREIIAEEMVTLDVDAPAIVLQGRVHRRVLRQSQTYMTSAGEVVVERWLYKDRADSKGKCVSPMELSLGIVGDFWTPRAASQTLWVVSQMTPKKAAELFERMGNMEPSRSSIDRLPRELSETWEKQREASEQALRDAFVLPDGTASIAVSLDGVLAPIDGGESPSQVRAEALQEGRVSKGPAGYREAACATVAFCDAEGELLGAIRMARAPESKKLTLKQKLVAEVAAVMQRNPALKLIKLADGAADNWEFLSSEALPEGLEALDFFHASEHLHEAISSVYGHGTREGTYRYEELREKLRLEAQGVEKVIRALKHLANKHRGNSVLSRELAYFRKHRHRMNYATLTKQGLMIGSGVVEAACKTLVAQRLKQSGMRWSVAGAQAILTPRSWDQSERFDEAWALLAAAFHAEVTVFANVIAFKPKPDSHKKVSASR